MSLAEEPWEGDNEILVLPATVPWESDREQMLFQTRSEAKVNKSVGYQDIRSTQHKFKLLNKPENQVGHCKDNIGELGSNVVKTLELFKLYCCPDNYSRV